MPNPESFARNLTTRFEMNSSQGIPMLWCEVPHDETLALLETRIAHEVAYPLIKSDLPEIGPKLFDGGDVLDQMVSFIGKSGHHIDQVRSAQLNLGRKALILIHEVAVDGKPYYFTTYLSRGPEGTKLGNETLTDYNNLTSLAAQFESRLKPKAKKKYRVVKPIAFGYTPEHNGKRYPFFTMPFIGDADEIVYDVIPYGNSLQIGAPCIKYPFAYDENMARINELQRQKTIKMMDTVTRLVQRYGVLQKAMDIFGQSASGRKLKGIREDILTELALVYLLSPGKFPREFQINSGDLMARLTEDGIGNITLITLRGGYEENMTENDLYQRLQGHQEPYYHQYGTINPLFFPVFYDVERQELDRIMSKAKSLLVTQ